MKHYEDMTEGEFEEYLEAIRFRKKYADRYYMESLFDSGIPFEEWMKAEIRKEKIEQLGL